MANKNLQQAKVSKNDEFYTLYPDIEKELIHYKEQLRDKIIYCNCDSVESNFVKYFTDNFDELGIKKLLHSSCDFRSNESVEMLKKCDIVITNPPFSLFREYIAQLVEHDKKFLIIGSMNAITYKEIFPLIKNNKLRLGYSMVKTFVLPDTSVKEFGNINWYTNLDTIKLNQPLMLTKLHNEIDYPKYDNYDAINVDKVKDIPSDYIGVMGVPITYLDKHCASQFEILGCNRGMGQDEIGYYGRSTYVKGRETFKRFFIKKISNN